MIKELTTLGTCLLLKYMWKVTKSLIRLLSGEQSRKYFIELIVGIKSVPGAWRAMLIGAFHLKQEVL